VPRISVIKDQQWREMVAREGGEVPPLAAMPRVDGDGDGDGEGTDAELPCPACGLAAPLVEGACSDCGLQLE
jgi:hypothetical protein